MIPIQVRDAERTALELLKPAIEHALYDAGVELQIPDRYTGVRGFYDSNIKINKTAYAAIEEFDLPLIRTWYKYGQYEPYDEIRPKSLDVGPNSRDAYVPSSLKTDVTQGRIKEYLLERDLKSIMEQDLFDFLIENYNEWEPEPYTESYVANAKILQVLDEIWNSSKESFILNASEHRRQLKQASIDLEYQMKRIDSFEEASRDHIKTYLRNLSEVLLKIDENSEISDAQAEVVVQSRLTYHEFVWPWAALTISLDKAKGPEESIESFNRSGREMLETEINTYRTYLKGWESSLEDTGLKADLDSYRTLGQPTPQAIQNLQRAATENE